MRPLKPKKCFKLEPTPKYPTLASFIEASKRAANATGKGLVIISLGAALNGCEVGLENETGDKDLDGGITLPQKDTGFAGDDDDDDNDDNDDNDINLIGTVLSLTDEAGRTVYKSEDYWWGEATYHLSLVLEYAEEEGSPADYIQKNKERFLALSDGLVSEMIEELKYNGKKASNELREEIVKSFKEELGKNGQNEAAIKKAMFEATNVYWDEALDGDVAAPSVFLPQDGERHLVWQDFYGSITYSITAYDWDYYWNAVDHIVANAEEFLSIADKKLLERMPYEYYDQGVVEERSKEIMKAFNEALKGKGFDEKVLDELYLNIGSIEDGALAGEMPEPIP